MKLSVSLPSKDVAFLDEYAKAVGAPSRSAVLHIAVGLLRENKLGSDYAEAWSEWDAGEAELWESVTNDALAAGE